MKKKEEKINFRDRDIVFIDLETTGLDLEKHEILKDLTKLAPKAMIAGWKVDFDWSFLEKGYKKYNIKHSFDYHLIDCISIAYYYFRDKKEPAELRLGSVCRTLEIPIHEKHGEGEGHGAMTDILATFEVFKKL